MNRPVLILLSGLPGTGKTTVARALAAATGAIHLESDAVRLSVVPAPTHEPGESARVFAAIREQAADHLRAGRSVIIDATNLRERDRAPMVSLVAGLGLRSLAVRCVAPEPTVRSRLGGPRDGASTAGVAVYERMRGAEEIHRRACVVIDTSHDTASSLAVIVAMAGV